MSFSENISIMKKELDSLLEQYQCYLNSSVKEVYKSELDTFMQAYVK
jgi:hypothetical protein